MLETRRALYVLVAAGLVAGFVGGVYTVGLLTDAELVRVTFRTGTIASVAVAGRLGRPGAAD